MSPPMQRLAVVLIAGAAVSGVAQDLEVETYTVPRPVLATVPDYPAAAAQRGEEGSVTVYFMVGTDGRAFDPIVAATIGNGAFEAAALEALEESRFEPARRAGEPIVGSASQRYSFVLEGGVDSASAEFVLDYRGFQNALRSEDRERIDAALEQLERSGASNRYELAFIGLARYRYAARYGSPLEQMHYLGEALSGSAEESDPVYLDEDLVRELRRALLPLQLQHNDFPAALDTYSLMEVEGDEEGVAFFADTIGQVRAIEFDDTEFFVPLSIDDSGSAWVRLFKHNIAFVDGEGELAEAKLRCEQRYVAFAVEREVSYAVPSEWGDCSMELVGASGTNVFLMQH